MPVALKPRLAFRRVRAELLDQRKSGRAFVTNPFEFELIGADYESWILGIKRQIRDETFEPGPIEYCNAPKGAGLVRPGARLNIADRVVFTSAVGACLGKISAATRWSQPRIDFACHINPKGLSKPEWLLSPFLGWKAWSEESLRRLGRKGRSSS